MISPSRRHPFSNYTNPAIWGSVTCLGILTDDYHKLTFGYKAIISHLTDMISPALPVIMLIYNSGPLLPALGILTDDYCKLTSRYKAIISHLTDTISPALPIIMLIYHSGPLLPALGILADDCHKPASRYPVIMSHLAGMISPSLPCSSSNDDLFGLLADYHQIQAARYSAIAEDLSHLTGQISQTLLYPINPETLRRLSSFCFLVTPIYHSCLLLPMSCQIQAARYPAIVKGLTGQISQTLLTLLHLINHEPSR